MPIRRAAVATLLFLAFALPLLAEAPPAPASTPAPAADQAFLASLAAAPADGALPAPVPRPLWMTCLSDCVSQLLACRQACHGNTQCQANCNDTYNCGCLCRGNNC